MQEEKLAEPVAADRRQAVHAAGRQAPRRADRVRAAAELLRAAKHPVILAGRVSRDVDAWNARVALAERLGARVVTDLKIGAAFPTDHPLHAGAPGGIVLAPEAAEAIRTADVILSLDWVDLAGTLKQPAATSPPRSCRCRVDHRLHNGWSMDYQGLPPVDVLIDCEPDAAVPALLAALGPGQAASRCRHARAEGIPEPAGDKLTVDHLAVALRSAVGERPTTPHPCLAVLERRELAVPPSARLSRLRRRRRRRRRPRHLGRRRAGAQRHAAGCRSRSAATAIS